MAPPDTTSTAAQDAYTPRQAAQDDDLDVRGIRYRVHYWGDPAKPLVVLLHGWADTGLSFQFLADELANDWYLAAPDWRGFGDTGWCPQGYWFPDYLADLEQLLAALSPVEPVRVAGHSMGGNVAWLYAGVRPQRISHVASLDAFGIADADPEQAPGRYAQWLDEWQQQPAFSGYADLDAAAQRVLKLAPGLDPVRARFIARTWTRTDAGGGLVLRHDPRHKRVNPILFRRAEARACWRNIAAATLLVLGGKSRFHRIWFEDGAAAECRAEMPQLQEAVVAEAGHMLHLEQPAALAGILRPFFAGGGNDRCSTP